MELTAIGLHLTVVGQPRQLIKNIQITTMLLNLGMSAHLNISHIASRAFRKLKSRSLCINMEKQLNNYLRKLTLITWVIQNRVSNWAIIWQVTSSDTHFVVHAQLCWITRQEQATQNTAVLVAAQKRATGRIPAVMLSIVELDVIRDGLVLRTFWRIPVDRSVHIVGSYISDLECRGNT